MDQALLARVQADDHVALVAADDLRVIAGRTGDRAALAGLHLDVVDDRADRNGRERHGVAGLHVDLRAGDDLVADRQVLRRQDVGRSSPSAYLISAMNAVRFGSYSSRSTLAGTSTLRRLKSTTVGLLQTAAAEAHGDAAVVVAAALRAQGLRQRLDRFALVELAIAAVDDDELATGWRMGLKVFRAIVRAPSTRRDVDLWPWASVTTAFLTSDRWPPGSAESLVLPLRTLSVLTFDRDVEQASTAALICGFVASWRTLNTTLFSRKQRRLFGDDRRDDHVVMADDPCSFETRLQRIDGGARQSTSFDAAQDVVDVDALDGQHVDLRMLRAKANLLLSGTVDDQRFQAGLLEGLFTAFGRAASACPTTMTPPSFILAESAWPRPRAFFGGGRARG